MCHTNLDLRRDAICRRRQTELSIPVLYVTQAVGLALGLEPRQLGLHRHNVPVRLPAREKPQPVKES
jgi:heterodisulfide reductase subunit B